MPGLTTDVIRKVRRVNGEEVGKVYAVGPFVSANAARYWLVRPWGSEFFLCDEPSTEGWGWSIDTQTATVHYAFATACESLLAFANSDLNLVGDSNAGGAKCLD